MKEYRLGKNTTEHYTSLQDLRNAWGCKQITKRTSDEKKLASQREAFCSKHKCKACGSNMIWVGGNQMTCGNSTCKGIKNERTLSDGTKLVTYDVSYELLDEVGAEIANNIFS